MHVTEQFERFNPKKPENYSLSIRLTTDGFSFLLHENKSRHIAGMRYYNFEGNWTWEDVASKLSEIIAKDKFLRLGYSQTAALVDTGRYTFLPVSFFQENQLKTYLSLTQPMADTDEIYYNQLRSAGMIAVFPVHTYISSALFEINSSLKIVHPVVPLLTAGARASLRNNFYFTGQLNGGNFDLAFFRKGELMFCNNFAISGPNDLAYFVLAAIRKSGFEASQVRVVFSGLSVRDEMFAIAERFLPGLQLLSLPEGVVLSRKQQRLPSAAFSLLFSYSFANH